MTPFDRDTVDRLLTTTKAVRKRLDLERPVPRELITECIRLGCYAPNASNAQEWWWVVVESDRGLSTPRIYAEFDKLMGGDVAVPTISSELYEALDSGDAERLAPCLSNDLQSAALGVRPELRAVLDIGEGAGALRGIVSGSGPTCVFLCATRPAADAVREAFLDAGYARVQAAPGPVAGAHEVTL